MTTVDRLLLTIPETADLLGIGRTAVYGLLDRGELSSVHIGRSRRIAHADLMSYVNRLRRADEPEMLASCSVRMAEPVRTNHRNENPDPGANPVGVREDACAGAIQPPA